MPFPGLSAAAFGGVWPGGDDKGMHRQTSEDLTNLGMLAGLNPGAAMSAADVLGIIKEVASSEGMTKFGPSGFDIEDIRANRVGQRQAVGNLAEPLVALVAQLRAAIKGDDTAVPAEAAPMAPRIEGGFPKQPGEDVPPEVAAFLQGAGRRR